MKVDITSMFFNSKIEGKTATPAWRTSIGQNKSKECRIETDVPGVTDMIIGMTYKMRTDLHNLNMTDVSGDLMLCAVFDKIYVNGNRVNGASYTLLLLRETSDSHEGRLQICYAPKITFNGQSNSATIDRMRETLGCSTNGCWFVYEIAIKNQDELHFSAVVVDENQPALYTGTSQDRSRLWRSLLPAADGETNYIPEDGTPRQVIYYGAPGTGKSHEVAKTTKQVEAETKANHEAERVFRTTFHPDSDYSTFVGCYKPTMQPEPQTYVVEGQEKPVVDKDGKQVMKEKIVYNYIPQAFTNAYVRAWQTDKDVYLVIEEINRGNCAQIFGDLFQLLDRDKDGYSKYPIDSDSDLGNYICKALLASERNDIPEEVKSGKKMQLPSNLYIWATMNTSDQSLFPIDSAFKRRWDWKYMKIKDMKDKIAQPYRIIVKDKQYSWWGFINKMNEHISSTTSSEDKQLGYFFVNREDGQISADDFVNKVLFYLYNDALKDYSVGLNIKNEQGELKAAKFSDFYDDNGEVITEKVQEALDDYIPKEETAPADE